LLQGGSMKNRKIYWIGGSPCSGKSTIAEKMAKDFRFHYYKCDDSLERYLEIASERGKPVSSRMQKFDIDETFLRPVNEQVKDELAFYEEVFEVILEDLDKLNVESDIVIEGAALLPSNIHKLGILNTNYICMVPTAEFQLNKYAEREWVNHYLSESKNKDQAYDNWMKRDIEFAKIVLENAKNNGYSSILVDGSSSIEQNYEKVLDVFKLKNLTTE